MFIAIAAKVAAATIVGFYIGFFSNAAANLGQPAMPLPDVGAFDGPVAHVGSIEWDLARPTAVGLRSVRCSRAVADTRCYVGR